jgi:hypothetical protein
VLKIVQLVRRSGRLGIDVLVTVPVETRLLLEPGGARVHVAPDDTISVLVAPSDEAATGGIGAGEIALDPRTGQCSFFRFPNRCTPCCAYFLPPHPDDVTLVQRAVSGALLRFIPNVIFAMIVSYVS